MVKTQREDIIEVLKQNYTHTCVIHPNLDSIYFYERSTSCVRSPGKKDNENNNIEEGNISSSCAIDKGAVKYCFGRNDDGNFNEDIEGPGVIQINNFMKELYRIYLKTEKTRDNNDGLILIAFSKALKKVQEKLSDMNPIKGKKHHYIFVVPTEWEHEIRDEIIRPTFIKAGIINDEDHLCRLLFYTNLDSLIFGLQKGSYKVIHINYPLKSVDNTAILDIGRRYTLYNLHTNEKSGFQIRSHSFDTIQTKSKTGSEGIFIMEPDNVSSSECYPLASLDDIRGSMFKLLQEKEVLLSSIDIEKEKRSIGMVIDSLIAEFFSSFKYQKRIKEIKTTREDNNNKIKRDVPFHQSLYKVWNRSNYISYSLRACSALIQIEKVKLVTMAEVYKAVFYKNQTSIEKLSGDEYRNQKGTSIVDSSIFLAVNDCWPNKDWGSAVCFSSDDEKEEKSSEEEEKSSEEEEISSEEEEISSEEEESSSEEEEKSSEEEERSSEKEEESEEEETNEEETNEEETNEEETNEVAAFLSQLYYEWMIHEMESHFLNDTDKILKSHYLFKYLDNLTQQTIEKFTTVSAPLINFLPPSILCAPEEDYSISPQPHLTIKSNPVFIVKADIALYEPSTFSCVKLKPNIEGIIDTIVFDEESSCLNFTKICFPPLSHFIKLNSHRRHENNAIGSLLIMENMLKIMVSHFGYVLKYFAKYDRQYTQKKLPLLYPYQEKPTLFLERLFPETNQDSVERLNTNEDGSEKLDTKEEETLPGHYLLHFKKDFKDIVPQIKLELEKHNRKNKLVEIRKESYIRTFLMIYLGVLKYDIDTFANKNIIKTKYLNEKIGYVLNVDALLFDKLLKRSYSSLKELTIASGFASNELDFKKNVRVITEREEQVLPILQQKSNTSLPLKSFFAHVRLHERYIHLSLNQVVVEGQTPEINAKNIVIKSKIVTSLGYLFDSICDNFWAAVNPSEYLGTEVNCKMHNGYHHQSQQEGFLMDELDGFKKKFICETKTLFSEKSDPSKIISITISDFCKCKLRFEYKDIVEYGIFPAIKSIISVITGAITNLDMFGLYAIDHCFVHFNYFTSVFDRSYEELLEYNLRKATDISLKKKHIQIPYTLFSEPDGGIMNILIQGKFILADSFAFGNLLQTSGETYTVKLGVLWCFGSPLYDCELHNDNNHVDENFFRKTEEGVEIILKPYDVVSSGRVMKNRLYVNHEGKRNQLCTYTFDMLKLFGNCTNNNKGSSFDCLQGNSDKEEASKNDLVWFERFYYGTFRVTYFKRAPYIAKQRYIPLSLYIEPLNHASLIRLTLEFGGFHPCFPDEDLIEDTIYTRSTSLVNRLTLMRTQY